MREWRKHRRLSQKQLAERLDTTEATVSRVENLKRDPTLSFLEAAAEALTCEVADLVGRFPPGPENATGTAEPTVVLNQIEELLKLSRKAS